MAGRSETAILLVRHGESTDNVDRRLGSLAPGAPLTDRGRAQASALGVRLAARKVAAVYASPVGSCPRERARSWPRRSAAISRRATNCERSVSARREGSTAESDIARVARSTCAGCRVTSTEGLDGDEPGGAVVARMSASLARSRARIPARPSSR